MNEGAEFHRRPFNGNGYYVPPPYFPAESTTYVHPRNSRQKIDRVYRKYFAPQQYIGVAVVNVYIGRLKRHGYYENIPMVARVSLVDYGGQSLLDTYIHATHPIADYRTSETGLTFMHLCNAPRFAEIQQRVSSLIRGKILVGHRIWVFLSVLGLSHSALHTRDLALFRPLRKKLQSRQVVDLPTLVDLYLEKNMLEYENSLEAACAGIELFRACEDIFEGVVGVGSWPCDLPPCGFAEYYS